MIKVTRVTNFKTYFKFRGKEYYIKNDKLMKLLNVEEGLLILTGVVFSLAFLYILL